MDSFEFNKIAGAVLATALGVLALGIISEIIFSPPHHEQPGYVIAVAETEGEGEATAAAEPEVEPIAARLQVASAEEGMDIAKRCQACHTFEQGGPAKVGPNLWGIVGGPMAHMQGFGYSDALKAHAAEGTTWTYDELDAFLTNPKADIPGTAMSFAGIKQPEQRADVIAYLRTLSDSPEPLPPPPQADAGAAAGGGDAAAGGAENGAAAAPEASEQSGQPETAAPGAAPETEAAPGEGAAEQNPAAGTATPAEPEEGAPQPPAGATPEAPAANTPAPAQESPAPAGQSE